MEFDFGVAQGKDSEYLVRKCLSYAFHLIKIKNDHFEKLDSCQYSFGLRARNQLVIAILGKFDRHHRFIESIVIAG